jgi:hypothetical protein
MATAALGGGLGLAGARACGAGCREDRVRRVGILDILTIQIHMPGLPNCQIPMKSGQNSVEGKKGRTSGTCDHSTFCGTYGITNIFNGKEKTLINFSETFR